MSTSAPPASLLAGATVATAFALALLAGATQANAGETPVIVKKTGPSLTMVGDTATFTVSIENVGGAAISRGDKLKMTDVIPNTFGIPYTVQGGAFWTCASNSYVQQVACEYIGPPISPGAPFPPITITAKAVAQGTFENCAKVFFAGKGKAPADAATGCSAGQVRMDPRTSLCELGTRSVAPARVMIYDKKVPFRIFVGAIGNGPCETARVKSILVYLDAGQLTAKNLSADLMSLKTAGSWKAEGPPTDERILRTPNAPLDTSGPPLLYGGALRPSNYGVTGAQDGLLICSISVVNAWEFSAPYTALAAALLDPGSRPKSGQPEWFTAWANRINNALENVGQRNASCSGVNFK